MMARATVNIPTDELVELCQCYYVRELALFGSVLRDDFRDESDIDILVEFEPGAPFGLIEYIRLQNELADLIGRPVDLVEKSGLKRFLRDSVVDGSQVLCAMA